jgi:hypothetical protein
MVGLACWDSEVPDAADRASIVHYAPSTAPLPTQDGGGEVIGQFAPLAIGYAVFQVFTVDYVEAAVRGRLSGTLTRQTALLMRSASSGRTVYALVLSHGLTTLPGRQL